MITLTQLTQDLQIGKSKLYRLMKELEINPHQDGRRRLLDQEQFQKIQQAISSQEDSTPTTKNSKSKVEQESTQQIIALQEVVVFEKASRRAVPRKVRIVEDSGVGEASLSANGANDWDSFK